MKGWLVEDMGSVMMMWVGTARAIPAQRVGLELLVRISAALHPNFHATFMGMDFPHLNLVLAMSSCCCSLVPKSECGLLHLQVGVFDPLSGRCRFKLPAAQTLFYKKY